MDKPKFKYEVRRYREHPQPYRAVATFRWQWVADLVAGMLTMVGDPADDHVVVPRYVFRRTGGLL